LGKPAVSRRVQALAERAPPGQLRPPEQNRKFST